MISERPVGLLERYSVSRHNVGLYTNLVVGVTYGQLITDDKLDTAVRSAIAEHPFLSAVLLDSDTDYPSWGRLTDIDPARIIVHHTEEIECDQLLSDLHSALFDVQNHSLPLWRLHVLPHKVGDRKTISLLICAHHAICDGIGLLAVHDSIYRGLHGQVADLQSAKQQTLPPAFDTLHDCRSGILLLLRAVITDLLLPAWISRKLGLVTLFHRGKRIPPIADQPHRTLARTFATRSLHDLLAACRIYGISLTSLFYACFGAACAQVLKPNEDGVRTLRASVAINSRSLCGMAVDATTCGSYSTGLMAGVPSSLSLTSRPPTRRQLLTIAQNIHARLHNPSLHINCAEAVGLMGHIPKKERQADSPYKYDTGTDHFFRQQAQGSSGGATYSLSNLGKWTPSTLANEQYTIENAFLSQSVGALGELICLSSVTVNDILTNVINWQQGTLQVDEVERIVSAFNAACQLFITAE